MSFESALFFFLLLLRESAVLDEVAQVVLWLAFVDAFNLLIIALVIEAHGMEGSDSWPVWLATSSEE